MTKLLLNRSCIAAILFVSIARLSLADTPLISVATPSWLNGPEAGGWQFSDPTLVTLNHAAGDEPYVEVVNPQAMPRPAVFATLSLPLTPLKGGLALISVDVRVSDVSRPPHSYNGVKAMVHVVAESEADSWDQAAGNGDGAFPVTYGWKRETFQTVIPADATSAILALGLQESTGEVDFRDLRISVMHPHTVNLRINGPLYTGHGQGSLRGCMISPEILPADVATLKAWHVNLVRWQLNDDSTPRLADSEDPASYDLWLSGQLSHLDELLPYFRDAGIMVVLDLHTPPGGQDNSGIHRIFTSSLWEKGYLSDWLAMAKRYRHEKQIWGYDLCNEPITPGIGNGIISWHDLAEQVSREIRTVDRTHAIIVEPDPGGGVDKLAYFQPIDVPGVVYSVHMYDPGGFTQQGVGGPETVAVSYPGVIDGQLWNRERISKEFQPVVDFAAANNVQIYVGEFSAIRWAPGADRYLADVISVMEEHHWDWSYHAFREWQGWSAEIGDDISVTTPTATPTARLRVLEAAYAANRPQSGDDKGLQASGK